jgi:hypothetical protein
MAGRLASITATQSCAWGVGEHPQTLKMSKRIGIANVCFDVPMTLLRTLGRMFAFRSGGCPQRCA